MANKKFDYSNDIAQPDVTPQNGNSDCKELRRRRLEQRNDALAKEFRDLKPEIGRAYNQLCNLVEKSSVLSETMLNLLELLKTVLPVRLSDEDKKALQNELHGIANNVISKIRKKREKMENDIRKNGQSRFPYSCNILVHGCAPDILLDILCDCYFRQYEIVSFRNTDGNNNHTFNLDCADAYNYCSN